jgi:hypothetical protein
MRGRRALIAGLGVADLLAIDVEQSHPVGAALDDERALAVRGDCDGNRQRCRRCRNRGRRLGSYRHNHAGTLALVANRAEDSVTVLAIEGKNVKSVGTVQGQ